MLSKAVTYILVVLILLVLSLAILANSMTKPIARDEQMYCTGAVLLAQGRTIYRDFSYIAQMPYHPLLCAALFKIFNTTHYLLVCRILSALCDIFVVICIVGIYRCVFRSFPISGLLLGLAASVLYVFNPVVDYANGFAWNNDIIILCVLLSFWLFISIDFGRKSKYWRIAAIGALLTFATCMRITTALIQALFFAVFLIQPADSVKQRIKTALPFLIAVAAVLIWPIRTIALAPRAFYLNLLWIPMLNSEWLNKIGMVYNKFALILSSLTMPGYLALIVIAAYLCLTIIWNRRRLNISNKTDPSFAIMLTLTFFVIASVMPATWMQHLAMPVPLLVITFAYPLLYLRELTAGTSPHKHFNTAVIVVTACTFVAAASYPFVLHRIPQLFNRQNWAPLHLHSISQDIANRAKSPKLILTLSPLFALEGGSNIYLQLSAGPFVYRIADFMNPDDLVVTNTVSPKTLGELLEHSPPSAVILGFEPSFLEESLYQTAVKPDRERWERKVYDNGPVVYFRR
jgi:hypothetical protein